ncbi:glutamate--tRNA ligase [Streptomyces acidiscabies]|uniref:Glutamate--tRNA ligase n=1 Tax=Streptomyces acidiscabies TaxID=42234 RepID=A0AAP6BFY0_9ACTN|nr:glutamate--tRNA ligase [Streptomyces acidiscabies]MBP5936589.1 glutamate--tRNA ligase [Streptomyces sp. LBUM 1476]MBZ3915416.1 glutamate--tRNA ligase [Streptomyces acidiscabies]MDX2964035.1 glutamate--tRNA ligase [Streptomyces acidiscabies]MDX3022411.1 glutamate--tRNA ligase [Streptomyces acidiscabies]MDX3794413.1 glutamate--tRNA ligase [Streptomyces acidiscabies]
MSSVTSAPVRVRFCPSPTGNPHVGLVRTALFNWAFARHHQGTLVFRIEDTDAARDSEESYNQLLDAMRWLGFDWDEGPEIGGPHAPYRQSQRMDLYKDVAQKLQDAGHAYRCYCSTEELDARRDAARAAGKPSGYDGHCRDLTEEQKAAYEAEGRKPIVRFRMPDETITFTDLVRGELTFTPENVPDYGIVRANGAPLYTLVNPVDDALMEITHVLRGEDLLSSTPRQIALYKALIELGVAKYTPEFGHLPYVMGEGNKKLSKRDPQASLNLYREKGFLPEGLLNYLSLLGWSLSADEDIFTTDQLIAAFDIKDVNPNPARFDLKKCEAINGDHIRMLDVKDFTERCAPWLQAPFAPWSPEDFDEAKWQAIAPHAQTRLKVLSEITDNVDFLFLPQPVEDEASWTKAMKDGSDALLATAREKLETADWTSPESLKEAVLAAGEAHGLKLGKAQAPVRVAITGRTVGLPLFESLEVLGKEASLARIDAALAKLAA